MGWWLPVVVEILVICLIAKAKRFRLSYLWHTWTFYPILLAQVLLVALQATVFLRDFRLVPYGACVEIGVILSFLFALLAFGLYKPALVGSLSIAAGTVLNRFAIAQNGGHMPVFPTLSYLTGYIDPSVFGTADQLHTLGNAATRVWYLTDYIDYGYSVLSPGDLLIHLYACLMFYALIRAVNLRFAPRQALQTKGES